MAASFVHLHVHTEYSLVDGLIRLKPLVKETLAAGMPAVAVTDMSNLFAMVKFYRAAQAAGVKPIIGVDLWAQREQGDPARLVLLCQDESGYRNLTRLVSRSYLEGQQRGVPVVQYDWLEGATDGLIALSGGREGEIGRILLGHKAVQARRLLADWLKLFPDRYYLEVQRTGRPGEEEYLQAAIDLAAAGLPLVASNDVRFLRREEFDAHEARVCIQEGVTLADPARVRRYSDQQYLRTPAEMADLFADLPEALANSVEIARRCNLELELGRNFLPAFPVPEWMNAESYFAAQARAGLEKRLERLAPRADPAGEERRQQYEERLERELGVICQMGFPGYFLIVADFIQWARDHGVPVGPGRGSGAGSLVAYALGITDLDPLAYDLLFERFLNPERVSMPDFDVDFCMEGRDRVIDYVAARYGRDRVSQIATHGTMAAKAVVRDVGRVLGYPYGFVDRIAKLVPFEIGMTLDKALGQEEEFRKLYEEDGEVRNLIDLARALEGLARNVGRHAGGVVIAPSPLTDFSPLYCEQGSEALVTQFDKDDVELAGLVKFDFLGLRTLTIIDWAVQTINRQRAARGEPLLDITVLPLADSAAFDLLKACRTTAVFQLESRGMKDLIKRLQPDCFEDIIALVALFRPGPLQSGMVEDFIDRKHGRARVEYPHPELASILKPTYGVILYQEQVMQIAQVLAGYTLGGADLLRRAMGKKKPEEMAKQRAVFVEGAVTRGADRELAGFIFDLMEKFAGYGFNKCVVGETLVADPDSGEQRTVKDLFRNGIGRVASLQRDGAMGCSPVAQVMENGIRPVFRLTTSLGKSIVATANHPLLTAAGWRPLSELQAGDRIAAPDRLPIEGTEVWPDHELIALGWTLAEGNTCHPSGFYFYNKDSAARDDFIAAASRFPDTQPTVRRREDRPDTWEVYVGTGQQARFKTGSGHSFTPRSGARLWLEGLGMIGHKAGDKHYPTGVFRLDNRCLALLLGRLWSGDGYIAGSNGNNMIPYLATASEQLARETQHLLLRLDMVSRLTEKRFPYKEGRTGYTLHLLGRTSVERFVTVIGPHLVGRDASLAALRRYLAETPPGLEAVDTLPAEVKFLVREEKGRAGLTWTEVDARSGVCMKEFYGRLRPHKRGFRRETIRRLAGFFGSPELAQAAAGEIFWERIVRIEPAGVAMTYDLEVAGTHNFVANDLLVHNSHSAAYALISYQTAWLKAHYPAAFMAAVLSSDMDKTDKVVVFIEECRSMGLELLPPSVNASDYRFTVDDRGRIIYGLGAIKGVGEGAIEGMLEERQRHGPFRDLFDLCRRVDLRKLNRRVLESLIRSGACDCLGANRATLMAQLPEALQLAEQNSRDAAAGQVDLFGLPADAAIPKRSASLVEAPEWDEGQRLVGEKETLGLYLTGHPIARFMAELQHFVTGRLADVAASGEQTVGYRQGQDKGKRTVVAGLVVGIRTRSDNRGKRMAFVTLDDRSARLEIRVFPEVYERYRHLIADDKVLVVQGESVWNDFSESMRLNAERLMDLETARQEYARRLVLSLDARQFGNGLLDNLAEALAPYRQGQCQVVVDYACPGARAEIVFDSSWGIRPAEALLGQLARLVGEERLRLEYH